jgi:apolipoprotein N-acyltransferase
MTAKGFGITFAAVAVQLIWLALFLLDVISWYAALDSLLVTLVLEIWLLPLLTPVQAARPSNRTNNEGRI